MPVDGFEFEFVQYKLYQNRYIYQMPLQPGLGADHKRVTGQEGRFIQHADAAIGCVVPERRVSLGLHGIRLD